MCIELHKFPHEINVVKTQTPNFVFWILSKLPILCQTVCTQKSEGQFIIQSIHLTLQNKNICDWLSMGRGCGLDFALSDSFSSWSFRMATAFVLQSGVLSYVRNSFLLNSCYRTCFISTLVSALTGSFCFLLHYQQSWNTLLYPHTRTRQPLPIWNCAV